MGTFRGMGGYQNEYGTPEIPEPAPSLFRHGVQIGGLHVFSLNQNNCCSSGAYVTASTSVCREDKTCVKCRMESKDRGHIGLACVVGKNPKTPKFSSMADDDITRGSIGGLGSLVYICGRKPGV